MYPGTKRLRAVPHDPRGPHGRRNVCSGLFLHCGTFTPQRSVPRRCRRSSAAFRHCRIKPDNNQVAWIVSRSSPGSSGLRKRFRCRKGPPWQTAIGGQSRGRPIRRAPNTLSNPHLAPISKPLQKWLERMMPVGLLVHLNHQFIAGFVGSTLSTILILRDRADNRRHSLPVSIQV